MMLMALLAYRADASKVSWLPDTQHSKEVSRAMLEVGTTHASSRWGNILPKEILTRISTQPERAEGEGRGKCSNIQIGISATASTQD